MRHSNYFPERKMPLTPPLVTPLKMFPKLEGDTCFNRRLKQQPRHPRDAYKDRDSAFGLNTSG